jgi:hypothetical protein
MQSEVTLNTTGQELILRLVSEAIEGIADAPPQFRQSIADLLQPFSELVSFEFDHVVAAGASESVVQFKPTKRLLDLVSAVRTWKREHLASKEGREIPVS